VSVTPTLARLLNTVFFTLSTNPSTVGGDFTTNTGIALVETTVGIQTGSIVSSKIMQVLQSVQDPLTNFSVSLDGDQFDGQASTSLLVEGFGMLLISFF
jgi:hypothetical protein